MPATLHRRRPAKIERLPKKIRDAALEIIREGGHTIDEITAAIRGLGGDVSRSGVGRYVKSFEERMRRFREAQQVAGEWIRELGQNPEGDVGRLLSETLKSIAYTQMGEGVHDDADAKELMMLTAALKNLASADKLGLERELRIRKELAAKVEGALEQAKKSGGLSEDTAAKIRAALVGEPKK